MATRALVLGGGGTIGIAWQTGLLKALEEGGVAPGAADLIVGTSAGSITGTQVAAGLSFDMLLTLQLQEFRQAQNAAQNGNAAHQVRARQGRARFDLPPLMVPFLARAAVPEMSPALRALVGRMALAARTVSEDAFVEAIGNLLTVTQWPAKRLLITTVDATSGRFVTWERTSGVPIERAVASSCAVPGVFPPVTIQGRRYIDGGIRSGTSADLARGHRAVLIIAPLGAQPGGISTLVRGQMEAEVRALRAAGSTVEVVLPDEAALVAFGPNLLDPRNRAAPAQAGVNQGRTLVPRLREVWQ